MTTDSPLLARSLETAVLFMVFNRPDTTKRVFEAISEARPPRLYVAADGPRSDRLGEAEKCETVRNIATSVDWPCEVYTLFHSDNLGCKRAVSVAITWFFEHENSGIILEDDCVPHLDFFEFCSNLLDRYENDDRVFAITGNNFQDGQIRGESSYYFSKYNHCWGWASWRRAWQHYQESIYFWPEWKHSIEWTRVCSDGVERRYWENIFDKVCAGSINSWDYPWTACVWKHGGLTATPNVNLVSNIGFGAEATHTASADSALSTIATASLGTLRHPTRVDHDRVADRYVFDHVFGGRSHRFLWPLLNLPRRVAKLVYRKMKKVAV
jgi:hypothetical protein